MSLKNEIKPFSLLIKPAGADCNLRCDYCFYLDRASLYPSARHHRMTETVLDGLIRNYMNTPQPQYAFAWQGGEPTLMGLDFFKKVVELQMKHGPSGTSVANHLQTNASLITPPLARHLARYRFLVGVSLDGPPSLHNRFRTYAGGNGSHARVMKGITLLQNHEVKVNVLTLVSQANIRAGREVYRYLLDQGFTYQQYIPCVEFDRQGQLQPFAVSPGEWGDFLCQVFDEWIASGFGRVSVRFFDSLIHYLVTGEYNVCHMGRQCCEYFVVEHNGDIYPCDFFVDPVLKLGNALKDSFLDLKKSDKYLAFGAQKRQWHSDCERCEYLPLCSADCLKHRLNHGRKNPRQKSWLCEGYRQFYRHALPRLKEKVTATLLLNQGSGAAFGPQTKPGRNDPCPCGSGLKYKKCCGRA